MIIDPHVHVWKNDPKYPWAKETTRPPDEDALPETLLAQMKANGVDKTVLVQVIYYRWDNRYTRDVMRQYPDKFMGVCRVNPESPASPDDLSRLVKEDGFHGVRLSPGAGPEGDWIRGDLMHPLWRRTAELRVPMLILAPITRMPDIAQLCDKHPNMDVCIDHMADCPADRPDQLPMLLDLARFPRVFVKISHTWNVSKQDYPYRDTHDQVKRIYDAFGRERLMWGTDWPMVEKKCGYAKALAVVRDEMRFFTAEDKEWILGKTVLKLWPFNAS
jgi:predicted TIM-barrel fold metal-dependent hydrolase